MSKFDKLWMLGIVATIPIMFIEFAIFRQWSHSLCFTAGQFLALFALFAKWTLED